MKLQFLSLVLGSSRDTLPLDQKRSMLCRSNMSESIHVCLDSHFNQAMCKGLTSGGVEKEHGITAQSPASAVISRSVRLIQNPSVQGICTFEVPVNKAQKDKSNTRIVYNMLKHNIN